MTAFTGPPAFFRTEAGSYWHRPRSGSQQRYGWSWRAWCGGSTGTSGSEWTDQPPGPICGTCEGREAGAMPDRGDLVFTPRGSVPPKWCPGGNRLDHAFAQIGTRVGRCLVCGNAEPIRMKGGPYDPTAGLATHAPGEGITGTRCDEHGWSELVFRDGRVECRCGPVGGVAS